MWTGKLAAALNPADDSVYTVTFIIERLASAIRECASVNIDITAANVKLAELHERNDHIRTIISQLDNARVAVYSSPTVQSLAALETEINYAVR